MEQASSRGHEASPQSGLSVGCKRCSSSIKLRGMGARAQARRISISLSFSVTFFLFLVPVFSAQRDEARRVEVQYRASVRGRFVSRPHCSSHFRGVTPCVLQTAT